MPTPLSEDIFQECIEQAVQKVFQTMLQKTATPVPGASPVPATADWTWPADLSATVAIGSVGWLVGFNAGLLAGALADTHKGGHTVEHRQVAVGEVAEAHRGR